MKSPFRILEVAETASDAEVQKAYLRKVREYPPDRAPERFQEIRAAYETLKTRRSRLHYQLFHSDPPGVETLLAPWLRTSTPRRPTEEQWRQVLAWSLDAEQKS